MTQVESPITIGGFEIIPTERTIKRLSDQQTIRLSKSECLIVRLLADQPNTAVSRDILLEQCWSGKVVTHSSLTVAIKHIRTAFADIGENNIIITEPKKGYLIRIPTEDNSSEELNHTSSSINNVLDEKNNIDSIRSKVSIYHKVISLYGIQLIFFIITSLALMQYILFVETTEINGRKVYYDGQELPSAVRSSIVMADEEHEELITYPLGGLCHYYQLMGVKNKTVYDLTESIEQSECDD
ncbi:winged helix-turn-helix domain-containing protein [Photobacterium minamisatsumaniensis]|uniref:winged helix-turn-helix domain-containing protein n=1 Tax=Photobacterium minamisatsumaniensis TaxID=2910233 RepID=UPI003D0CA4ED